MDKFVILSVLLLGVVTIFLWFYWTDEKDDKDSPDDTEIQKRHSRFYQNVVTLLDALQTQECSQIEGILGEIIENDSEKKEFYVIFGNVLREKGYITKAIEQHKLVLHRTDLTKEFKGWALACLAEDFRMSGMIERAMRTYEDAFNLNPHNITSVKNYIHLCKQMGDYEKLLSLLDVAGKLENRDNNESHRTEVAFVYNQLGEKLFEEGSVKEAELNFKKSIQISSQIFPAYINLAKLYLDEKTNRKNAEYYLKQLFQKVPDKAFLGLPLYRELAPDDYENTCLSIISKNQEDWRTRVELAKEYVDSNLEKAFELLIEAFKIVPHVLLVHQELWKILMRYPENKTFMAKYAKVADKVLVFNAPFICVSCKYKSSDILWKCPSCHGYNSFIESRI